MAYHIFPPIGVARLGNDHASFYIGPERPGDAGVEMDAMGNESPVASYKSSATKIKRQAARFRIFEETSPGVFSPASLPAGAAIEWTVELANKKGAVTRNGSPPSSPVRPVVPAGSASKVIKPGPRTISGANQSGEFFDSGTFLGLPVPLGELRTDKKQNLLVLGGFGFTSSPTGTPLTGSFYKNPNWHDDVADGPVSAKIHLSNGTVITNIAPAWAVVGTPDYAPLIDGVVTLYDVMRQVAFDHFGVAPLTPVSFTRDVYPLLSRMRRLRWVNLNPLWTDVSEDYANLANNSSAPAAALLRKQNADRVRAVEATLSDFSLTNWQNSVLDEWQAGNFQSDWTGVPPVPTSLTPEGLTQAALDGAVGQGFFPGIEAGILVRDRTIYSTPFDFRIDHGQLEAGDLTALMAQPWQADFRKCAGSWWPSQRPDNILPNPNATTQGAWAPGIISHQDMIDRFNELRFISPQVNSAGDLVFAAEP